VISTTAPVKGETWPETHLCPPVLLRDVVVLGKLPGIHGARADVPHLAAPHEVVQRAHGLLGGRVRIIAVDLVQVDVVGLEALRARSARIEGEAARGTYAKGRLDSLEDGRSGQTSIVDKLKCVAQVRLRSGEEPRPPLSDHTKALGHNDKLGARDAVL